MSFILKSIELKNIRSHEYFLFEPALEGITAIGGDNGAGKSSIVDAFAWSLYGTRPSGIRNRDFIRDGVDPRKKPVSVKSTLIISGIEYIVERKIITPQGTTECNVWGRNEESGKFSQVAGPAVTHVEKFIRSELGMNEKGFLTSVFIQQKQVDQIVSATPRERGAVIEELTGIASITRAISKANEESRNLQKSISMSIFKIGEVDEAKDKVNKQKAVHEELVEKEKAVIEKFAEMKKAYKEQKEDLDIQEIKVKKRVKLSHQAESLKREVDFLKQQAKDDIDYILKFKEKYGTTVYVDTNKSKKAVEEKREKTYKAQTKLGETEKEINANKENIEKCEILKHPFESVTEAEKELKKTEKLLKETVESLQNNKDEKAMLASEVRHSKITCEHMSKEKTNCPVCKSKIDNPEQLKKEIEEEIEKYKEKQAKVVEEIKTLEKKEKELTEDVKNIKIAIEAIKEEKRLSGKNKELSKKLQEITTDKDLMEADLKALEEEYHNSLQVKADKDALELAKKRSLTANTNIDKKEKELGQTEEEIKELGALTDRSYNALVKRVSEAQDQLMKMSSAGTKVRSQKELAFERLNDYKKDLKKTQEAMEKYNEMAKQISTASSAATMLAAFKSDRIENSIPTLEFFASDFLSKFTGDEFTKLSVDENFNTFVTTSEGVVRPVSQLSGGELSSTAIALRLGIAMLLNSTEKNLLILDEVLVSMDEDRARQIMETISSMTNSQIIFIAHDENINSVADKTVLVTKE